MMRSLLSFFVPRMGSRPPRRSGNRPISRREADSAATFDKVIDVALDEYRSLQQEKQIYIESSFAVASIVVLGTVAAITVVAQSGNWAVVLALPLAQIGILAFALFLSAMSLRHGMYLAVVEKRIERLAGKRLMNWETRGVKHWPKFEPRASTHEQSLTNGAIGLYVLSLAVFIALEIVVATNWYWVHGWYWDLGDPSRNEIYRHAVAIIYCIFASTALILLARTAEAEEPMPVEEFFAQSSLKAFDEGVLDRLSWLDGAQGHPTLIGPLINNFARQLRTVVQDDLVGSPALMHELLQDAHHAAARQRRIDLGG
jgi:hypothetical protein